MIDHTPGKAHKENEVAATSCGEGGGGSYDSVVRCENCGAILDSEHVDTDPLPHAWGEPKWEWDEKFTMAEAKFICSRNEAHTTSLQDDSPESSTTPATTEAPGKKTFTATVELDGVTYTDTKEIELPKMILPGLASDFGKGGSITLPYLDSTDNSLLANTLGGLLDFFFGSDYLYYEDGENYTKIPTNISYSAGTDLGAAPAAGQSFQLTVTYSPKNEADVYTGITRTYTVTIVENDNLG